MLPTSGTNAVGGNARRARELLGFAATWVSYALLTYRFRWVCDDAFISFRYARNWALGHGLRYNLGEHVPVEGYSNFLWVALCTLLDWLRADPTFWAPLLSFICGSLLLFVVFRALRRQLGLSLPTAVLATLTLGCFPPLAVWSTSGLETAAFALLLFVTFERLVLRRAGIAGITAGLAGLALALIRTEGIYWALLLIPLAGLARYWCRQPFRRPLLCYVLIVVIGYAVYFVCRYAYYDLPFANTAYAKVGISGLTLDRGWGYVVVFVLTFITPLAVLPGCAVALRKDRRPIGVCVVLLAVAVPAYAVVVGGDFMAMGRLLVPGLAFGTLLLGWLIQDLQGKSRRRWLPACAVGLVLVCVGLLPAWDVHLVPQALRERFHFRHKAPQYISELAQWEYQRGNAREWTAMGRTLKAYAQPGDSLVSGGIGAVGYYSDLFIYDRFGLVTRSVVTREVNDGLLTSPGHDKMVMLTFFVPDEPTLLAAELVPEAQLRGALAAQRAALHAYGLEDRYVLDFADADAAEDLLGPTHLVVWRRVDPGVDPAQAWQTLEQRIPPNSPQRPRRSQSEGE